jgi:hypothetical protein
MTQLTTEYAEELETLKKAYELGKKDIHDKLVQAEENFEKAHKAFTAAHPEGYHLTLKDGDFETTLSGTRTVDDKFTSKAANDVMEIFNMIFGM